MIRLRPSGVDELLIKRVRDWYEPGPGVFFTGIAGTASFSPAMLFTTGVNGAWYDPSDLTTLFQDAAGTTPVTAMEQPVGRMLDKSGRGNHAFNPTTPGTATFPVLSARYNLYVNTETLATQNVTTAATNYKLTFTGSGSITLSGTATGTYSAGSYTIACTAGTLTSTVSGTVTQADIRPANESIGQPAYQRVGNVAVTASDYDTVGFKPYLKFNGVNQWLQTNSIDFSYGDKMFVSAGVRKLSDAAAGLIFELSTNAGTRAGSFTLWASGGISAPGSTYDMWGFGSSAAGAQALNYAAPITNVITQLWDISQSAISTELTVRVNAVLPTRTNWLTSLGTGNYGNYPLYIGARAGSSNWFNGRLYQLVVAGKQASASEITNTETFINQKTGAY